MAELREVFLCVSLFLCFDFSICFSNSLDLPFQTKTTRVVSLHIKSSILYRFSSTSVTSTIINDDVRATETTFEVTLPDAAFISNFTLEIDGNIYQGEVRDKEIAKNAYDNARSKGDTAGHIETRPRDTNKFKISINIAAFSEVTFTLNYNELLQRRRGNYDHTIYVNPGQIVDSLLVEVTIQESRAITQLHVPPLRNDILTEHQNSIWNSYATVRRPSLTSAYIRYNPSPEDQKRASLQGMAGLFVVEYDVERTTNVGEVMVVNGYFVHYFAPQGIPRMKRKVLFILDTSGSMIGTKIRQLKIAMLDILSSLDKGDRFNIIKFTDVVTRWWNHTALVEVTSYSVNAAKEFINDVTADGWTNINDAVSMGLDLIQEDEDSHGFSPLIIFLTDGTATEGETDHSKILDTISTRNRKNVPIFSLSFGEDADYGFLKKMSAQNGGFVRKIYEASDASLQLTGFYGEISSTLLSNLTFRYLDDTVVGKSVTNTIYPTFFEGSEIVITGKMSDSNVSALALEICGTSSKGPLEWRTASTNNIFDLIQNSPSELVASNFSHITEKIWSYMTIKQLLINRLRERNTTARAELKRQALELALQYNFVTPLTSMVVTRPQDENVIQPSADYGLNDSPHSVWGEELKASQGLELAGNSPEYVDNDPHFIVRVKGLADSVCFDVMGNEGEVFNLVKDEISGIIVNAKVATTREGQNLNTNASHLKNGTESEKPNLKTYFGEITISGDRSVLNVSPSHWIVNGQEYTWKPSQTITVHKTKLVTDGTGKMIAVMFPHRITLLIVRHMRTKKQLELGKIHFLGFYIVDDRGFSWYTHGLLGQFIYRRISLEKKKMNKNGKTRGKLKVEGNTKRMRRVSALLGKRVNLATNSYVSCWMVQRNGRRLIDGVFTDYLVQNSTPSQNRKRKRSKT